MSLISGRVTVCHTHGSVGILGLFSSVKQASVDHANSTCYSKTQKILVLLLLLFSFLPYIVFFNIKVTAYIWRYRVKNVQTIQKFLQIPTEYSAASVWMQMYVKTCWIKHQDSFHFSISRIIQLSPRCFLSLHLSLAFKLSSAHTKPASAPWPAFVRGFGELLHSYCTDFRHICSSRAQSFVDNQMFHVRVFNQLIHQWVFILVAFFIQMCYFQEEFWQVILDKGYSYPCYLSQFVLLYKVTEINYLLL